MVERRITVRMIPRLVAVHELIFNTAAQSGLFSAQTRVRLAAIADEYTTLRLAIEEQKKRGTPIPPEFCMIGIDDDAPALSEVTKRLEGERDEGGAGRG